MLGLLGASFLLGCSPSQTATVCKQAQRTELLNTKLEAWTPTTPFTLESGNTAWIQVTHRPFLSTTLFGSLGAIAELHSLKNGAAPQIETDPNGDETSKDPAIIIQKPLTWQRLPFGAGSWQLYSESDPGIEVVSCPST